MVQMLEQPQAQQALADAARATVASVFDAKRFRDAIAAQLIRLDLCKDAA